MVPYRAMRERVLITGLGCISGFGVDLERFSDALMSGATAIRPIAAFDTSACRSHKMAKIDGFTPAAFIDPAKLRRIDEIGRLALASCRLAMQDAGVFDAPDHVRDGIGVVLGSYTAGAHSTVEYLDNLYARGPSGVSAMSFSNTVGNAAASLCGIEYKLRGPNVTVSYKEASSLAAIAYAFGLVRHGRTAAVVTGGADDVEPVFFAVHDRFRVLSPTDAGEEAARPFDRRRNGFVLGEGAYSVIIEAESAATARSARAYGELLGTGATSATCGINDWPYDHVQYTRAMRLALEDAAIDPSEVAVVFASANGTARLDPLEAAALTDVFGEHRVPVVSLKGALGECGAIGAGSIAAALLCLRGGAMPPTAGFQIPDPRCPVNVSACSRPASGPIALVNSFASGGTTYSAVVRATRSADGR
jgi:3-oxoacyl-[acyl-carrier-protein] synthase II